VLKRKHGGCRAQSGVGTAVSRVGRHVLGLQPGSSAEVAEHPCLTHSIVPSMRVDRGDKRCIIEFESEVGELLNKAHRGGQSVEQI
jgi:hypothetical protein